MSLYNDDAGDREAQILVIATSDLTTTVNTLSPVGANGDAIRLNVAPAPDGRLLAVVPARTMSWFGRPISMVQTRRLQRAPHRL